METPTLFYVETTMQDFLRMQGFPLLSGLVAFIILLVISSLVINGLRKAEATEGELQTARTLRNWVFGIFFVGWGYWALQVGIINHVPKNQIDHTVVNSRADNLEKNAQERLQEKNPE